MSTVQGTKQMSAAVIIIAAIHIRDSRVNFFASRNLNFRVGFSN